ncbi:MAG: hypothetical protein CMN73_09760 [Sphingomonas sp.]|nr:hypothetical protein [Sphingomonas sp.]
MAYIIGSIVGSLIAIYLLAALWEWLLFKRVLDDPLMGKLLSVGAAWLTSGVLGGFGMADRGPYYWPAFLIYAPAAAILALFAYRRGMQLREEIEFDA